VKGGKQERSLATPRRRITAHVETLHGELCIYEWTTKAVHALNPAAARVWEMCDGVNTIEQMRAAMRRDLRVPAAASIVEHALAPFDRAGRLEPGTLAGVWPLRIALSLWRSFSRWIAVDRGFRMLQACPKRRDTTHVEHLHGELCIYEWTTKTVHALNPAAARVWEMCDGRTTVDDMTAAVRRDQNVPDASSIVAHALAQFDRAGLLEPGTLAGVGPLVSRRALLRRIGVAAAIPVVTSIVAPTPLAAQSGNTRQFTYTGGPQSFMVPAGITSLQVDVVGGSGAGISAPPPAPGGRVQATLSVTPGETLTIMVGGNGEMNATSAFNGGGAGRNGGWGGGGASDIRRVSTRLIVAGGGGGGGPAGGGIGGAGGGLVGGAGTGACGGGGGGTQTAGGAGGAGGPGGTAGSPGTSGTGGQGASAAAGSFTGGSGGGGGYFGGGGGGACVGTAAAAGGGGSSFTDPSATSVVHTQGFGGSPHITLSW
jgi:hypothetical protein